MYFEYESMDTSSSSGSSPMSGLSRRHRRLSSSSQSIRELIDAENCLENITPSHCDLYLITRKKLSQMNTNAVKQSPDLRREVLLTSIHRTITSKSGLTHVTSEPMATTRPTDASLTSSGHKSLAPDCPQTGVTTVADNCDHQFKYVNMSSTTSTSTTTMATSSSSTRLMSTSSTKTTPSAIKKRNLSANPLPNCDFEDDWKTTTKRVKVGHGLEANPFDVSMESELDSGFCDNDLNDLTNNFHSLKTPFT